MLTERATFEAHGLHVTAVRFTADGKLLLSAGMDKLVKVWKVPSFDLALTLKGHSNSVNTLAFAPDQRRLLTGSTDKTVKLWSWPDGKLLDTFPKQSAAWFAPDGALVASITPDFKGLLWRLDGEGEVTTLDAAKQRVIQIAFAPDGRHLVASVMGGEVRVFTAPEGTPVTRWTAHPGVTCSLCYFEAGRKLATSGADGYVRVWRTGEAKEWKQELAVKLPAAGVLQLAISPDERLLAVTMDHRVDLFALKDGQPLASAAIPAKGVYGAAFSPNGKLLAVAAADKKVRVYDVS